MLKIKSLYCFSWTKSSLTQRNIVRSGWNVIVPVSIGPISLRGRRKKGRGRGREKGKREGSACSKSLCFCITPTNFLVIRLRLLSIKCRYTRHCRKTLHSRTKEIRLVIQIQKALWRKLEPLFSRNKKALRFKRGQRKCACIRGQILPTRKQ